MCIKIEKKKTHLEVGEEKHTSSSYMKIKYNSCKNGHKTDVQEAKRSS